MIDKCLGNKGPGNPSDHNSREELNHAKDEATLTPVPAAPSPEGPCCCSNSTAARERAAKTSSTEVE